MSEGSAAEMLPNAYTQRIRAISVPEDPLFSTICCAVVLEDRIAINKKQFSRLTDGYCVFSTTETVSFRGIFDVEPFYDRREP